MNHKEMNRHLNKVGQEIAEKHGLKVEENVLKINGNY